jgi:hypothetical protein
MVELPDSTMAVSYLKTTGPAEIIRVICNGSGNKLDSISIPFQGNPIFVESGVIYIQNGTSLTKLNPYGDTIWSQINPATGNYILTSLVELKNGGTIAVGSKYDPQGFKLGYVLKYSASGALLWAKEHYYGGGAFDKIYAAPEDSLFYAVLDYQASAVLFQLDSLGEERWSKQIGGQVSRIHDLKVLEDGNIIFTFKYTAYPSSPVHIECKLMKYGPDGNFIKVAPMQQYQPDTLTGTIFNISTLIHTAPHEYALYYIRNTSGMNKNLVFVKVNEQLDSLCTETYSQDIVGFAPLQHGKLGRAFKYGDTCKVSNSLVICGADICEDIITPIDTLSHDDPQFAIFPNPTNNLLTISWFGINDATLIITNSMGVEVFSQPLQSENLKIDVSQYSTGFYTVFIKPKTGKLITRKFLVLP